ncbi:MAG: hypothetical protein Q7S43_02195 [bacterium]|nr:hypothetical protein [bacterium]
MFTNLIKKIADRDYLLFSQCFFDFTFGGERDCKIKIIAYDLKGNIREEVDMDNLTNNLHFLLYGSYIVSWLAQIFESENGVGRVITTFWEKWGMVFDALFNVVGQTSRYDSSSGYDSSKKYNLPYVLSLFDQKTKDAVIENHATIQFKIHKVYKNLLVRAVNVPIEQEIKGQIYLFVILFDFFCKKYVNAHQILGFGCSTLKNYTNRNPHRSVRYVASKIIETMFDDPENMSVITWWNFDGKVLDNIMNDKNRG